MAKNKLFLIDAFAIIFRAYFGFGNNQRYNSNGLNTSVTLGFCNTLLEVLKKQNPSHIAVVFDAPGNTFRNELYPEYKAHRNETPEDIKVSIPYVKRLIEAFNIPIIEKVGFEADDVIGTIAKMAEKEDFQTFMMTPDKDFAQLVSENIFMYRPGKSGKPAEIWGVPEVQEKFEVEHPDQVIDILGMWGDSADNIPGIPGIGEKTSKKLVKAYGSLEGLLQHTDDLKGKQKENVINFGDQGILSKKLATIVTDAPIEIDFEKMVIDNWNEDALLTLFSEMEFRTLAKRVLGADISNTAQKASVHPTNASGQLDLFASTEDVIDTDEQLSEGEIKTINDVEHDYHLVESETEIKRLIELLDQTESFCFDTETTGLDALTAEVVGLAFSWQEHTGYYVYIKEGDEQQVLDLFKPVFANEKIGKVAQNIKYDINVLVKYGVEVRGKLFDTMLAHYLLQPDMKHNMDFLSETYLNYRPVSIETLIGRKGKNQKSMRDVEKSLLVQYAAEDADITWQLMKKFNPLLDQKDVRKLFEEIEMPLVPVLSTMEQNGVVLNTDTLKAYSLELEREIQELEKVVIEQAGESFNVSSPKQLGEVLFERMNIDEKAKKTKSGQYSTSEETLQKLAGKHPIIDNVLAFRQLKKLKSTYVDALPELVNKTSGKIHTTYSQAVAATGRLSSNNPNLQNIPIKTEKGKKVRDAFIPSNGNELFAADYSQVELRLMAEMSGDKNMVEAFQKGYDIHTATAAKVFKVDMSDVDREMRNKAKMVNFGIIYGISAFGLSQRLNIKRKEAKELIDGYFATYPGIRQFMDTAVERAKEQGYVQTILKRKRFLKDINSKNAVVRGYAERNAINAPIQGSAADIIKVAMINIHKEMRALNLKSKMILQVHDELVFDVCPDEKDTVAKLAKFQMENAVKTTVPLEVEGAYGATWLEAH
ncbi:MAG: DNA polymerase I [Flavobacteriales bacterium]|nr:DNA polymerase I [Flavobacteriales bacterium]|tara:strand:- start:106835 stop:109633 length:2799 start_codon:yes stop_codon:yes gene_type:complete